MGCLTFAILFQPEAPQTQIERRPLPAAEAKEEEVGNLLLEMDEEEEIRVRMFTLEEALTATKVDYRCDPEVALVLWLYVGSNA